MRFTIAAILCLFCQYGFTQYGLNFQFLHAQTQEVDFASGSFQANDLVGYGLSTSLEYRFKEKVRQFVPQQKSLSLGVQTLSRAIIIGNQTVSSNWVRVPLRTSTHVPVRVKGTDQTLFTISSGAGVHWSKPIFMDQSVLLQQLPVRYSTLGLNADFGFQLVGPFATRLTFSYMLSWDFGSFGSIDSPSWEKQKFFERGFNIGFYRTFEGMREQNKMVREKWKGEQKARREREKKEKN